MEISQAILDDLTAKAKASERLRVNLDLRDSVTDDSQRTWQGTGTWQYAAYTQTPHGRGRVRGMNVQTPHGRAWQGTGTWHERASLLPGMAGDGYVAGRIHGRGRVRGMNLVQVCYHRWY